MDILFLVRIPHELDCIKPNILGIQLKSFVGGFAFQIRYGNKFYNIVRSRDACNKIQHHVNM